MLGAPPDRRALSAPFALATGLAVSTLAGAAVAQTVDDPALEVTTVATGLLAPTTLDFLGPDDLLVLEQRVGRVHRVRAGSAELVLDVAVHSQGERGLLGIAVNDEVPPAVFLYYTESATGDDTISPTSIPLGNRIYRYDWSPTTGRLESPQLILDLPVTPGPVHNGGIVLLGPPGEGSVGNGQLLYAVIGDLNRNGQLENFPAGSPPDDSGVILRLEQDGSPAAGNPFTPYCSASTAIPCSVDANCPGGETCTTAVGRYWAYGVRNCFGLALDPLTGALWDTENGPATFDEVNRIESGMNSGWEQIMGPDGLDPEDPSALFDVPGAGSTYSDPEFSWFDTLAPTALVFPAGSALGPAYDGVALVGDANNGAIYRFPLDAARAGFDFGAPDLAPLQDLVAETQAEADLLRLGSGFGAVTDLKLGPDGALYVVSFTGGAIYRIARAPSAVPAARGAGLVVAFASLLAGTWLALRRGRA